MVITPWSHQTTLEADPMSVSLARDFVCVHLVEHELSDMVDDVLLVTSELATNAVLHAQTPFKVVLHGSTAMVVLQIQDGAPAAPVTREPEVMDMNGRGLMLVELLATEWGISTTGDDQKTVWANFSTTD